MLLKLFLTLLFILSLSACNLFAGGNLTRIVLTSDKTLTDAELLAVRESTIVVLYPPNVDEERLNQKGVIIMEIQKSVIQSITLYGAGDGYTGTGAIIGSVVGMSIAGALLSEVRSESNSGTHRADASLVVLGLASLGGVGAGVGALLGSTFKEDVVVELTSLESFSSLRAYARYTNGEPEFLQSAITKRVGY
jgi:hypothetical protein